jgi:hypothetical protein
MTAFPSYSVGTASVKKGDTVIVGAGGTIWTSTVNVQSGDDIIIAGHIWPISDVTDANHLAIDPWPFDDVPPGSPYKILQRSPLRFSGATAAANVMRLVNAIDTEGVFRIVQAGAAAPDPSLGEENQFALLPSTFKLWLKTGGAWVFQGIFKGFRIQGPYSATAAYLANDIVSQDGSSYVALVDNTGQPVTNAAVWALFAAKGDPGLQGPQGAPGADGTNGTNGAGYAATSTTSMTIGKGTQTFATQAGLAYSAGARARASNGANYMEGQVTAYDGGNLTINVDRTAGSGTFASWNINLAGDPGAGTGDMLAANNLSDVSNKDVALANLRGISFGAAQSLTAAQQQQARNNISAIAVVKVQKFTANGTYTPSAGMLFCIIECVGGGGGGGGVAGTTGGPNCGGGGGGGECSRKYASATTIGASQAVTVGPGGAGGVGANNGGAGGDTSVGTLCIAKGGSPGSGGNQLASIGRGGAGGTGGTGDLSVPGGTGEDAFFIPATGSADNATNYGGDAGLGFGVGAVTSGPTNATISNGRTGGNFGGGGSGGQANDVAANAAGGAGAPGVVFITEFCMQ